MGETEPTSSRQSMEFGTGSRINLSLNWIVVSYQNSSTEAYLNAKYFFGNSFNIKSAKGIERGGIDPQAWVNFDEDSLRL